MVHDEIADEDAPSECIVYAAKHPVTDLHNVIGLKHRHVAGNESNTCHSSTGCQ